jgi:hypothetical protein
MECVGVDQRRWLGAPYLNIAVPASEDGRQSSGWDNNSQSPMGPRLGMMSSDRPNAPIRISVSHRAGQIAAELTC